MVNKNDLDEEWVSFLGNGAAPVTDTRADGRLYRLPLARLSPNLVNPRTDFGTEESLLDLGRSLQRKQNQPCPAVSRGAYLKLWPDHADRVGNIDYVLVSGERRFRGASLIGLATLDCVVNDAFATDRKTFLEAVFSENFERENFNAIEEANAVAALVKEFGTNRAVAQHFEKVDGWVTQRVNLTFLSTELQQLVRTKAIPLEDARALGALVKNEKVTTDPADQLAWWEERKAAKEEAKAEARARKAEAKAAKAAAPSPQPRTESAAPTPVPPSFTAVKLDPPTPAAPQAVPPVAPGPAPAAEPSAPAMRPAEPQHDEVPTQRHGDSALPTSPAQPDRPVPGYTMYRNLPWKDGNALAELVVERMEPEQQAILLKRLLALHGPAAGA